MGHYDCKYYLAVDVFKGICKMNKTDIDADDQSCEKFEKAKKCKNCSNYSSMENHLGLCMDKAEAYPEMAAVTCDDFKWC